MDRVLFTMPEAPREFFYAMCVAQAYVFEYIQEAHLGMRWNKFQFTYRMDPKYEKYELPLKVGVENASPDYDYFGYNVLQRSEYGNFINFDFPRATELALRTGRHITDAMSIIVGCKARKTPILPPPESKDGNGILVIDNPKVVDVFKDGLGPDSVRGVSLVHDDPLSIDVSEFAYVIGPACTWTHLAAAYNRKLIEVFSTMDEYYLYNNLGINNYQPVIGNPSLDNIFDAWDKLNEARYETILDKA